MEKAYFDVSLPFPLNKNSFDYSTLIFVFVFIFNHFQENSDKSVIELQQYARKNKPNLHILNKLQEEMTKLAKERVGNDSSKYQ